MPYLIDPEQIYPRRLGLYRGALVVEYYNIDKDTIKKHLIQFDNDSLESVDKIVENMLKNPKHSVFLRKVQPNDIKKVLSGRFSNILPQNINEKSQNDDKYNNYSRTKSNNGSYSYSNNTGSNQRSSYNTNSYSSNQRTSSYELSSKDKNSGYSASESNNTYSNANVSKQDAFKKKQLDQSGSYNLSNSKVSKHSKGKLQNYKNFEDSYSMNFDEESMNISVVPIKQLNKKQKPIDEQINYQDDFQELSSQKIEIKQKEKEKEKDKDKQKEKEKDKDKLKNKQKQKKPKKQQLEQFQFLDDEPKKKKKKKKEKSKQKDSSKSKSKQSSLNPSKDTSVKDQVPIQQQFDFI